MIDVPYIQSFFWIQVAPVLVITTATVLAVVVWALWPAKLSAGE